jgi:hypothetical protein
MRTLLATLLLSACAHRGASPAAAPIPPFTAAQIQAAMPEGTHLRFRLVEAGEPTVTTDWLVVANEPQSVTIQYTMRNAEGLVLGDPQRRTQTWAELESHAHFPVEATTWSEGPVTVPAGTFAHARTYVVGRVEEGQPVEDHFSFSLDHPGAPIRMLTTRFDAELLRMELVQRDGP